MHPMLPDAHGAAKPAATSTWDERIVMVADDADFDEWQREWRTGLGPSWPTGADGEALVRSGWLAAAGGAGLSRNRRPYQAVWYGLAAVAAVVAFSAPRGAAGRAGWK